MKYVKAIVLKNCKSSGGSAINADVPLSVKDSFLWLWQNFKFLRASSKVKYQPAVRQYLYEASAETLSEIDIAQLPTPSRLLCNSLWDDFNWDEIVASLGKDLQILECGCGNGRYGRRVVKTLEKYSPKYVGFDAVLNNRWAEDAIEMPSMEYRNSRSSDIKAMLDEIKPNLIISQSALEHFSDDYEFFQSVSDYCNGSSHPVLQIHMIPSPACLPLYLHHGYRQYCSVNINRIVDLFRGDYYMQNIRMGGWLEFMSMLLWVTLPTIGMQIFFPNRFPSAFRNKFRRFYLKSIRKIGIKPDRGLEPSSFFCMIIGTGGMSEVNICHGQLIPVSFHQGR